MAVPEADLCAFCSDLVGRIEDTLTLPQVRPHYPTYGPLLSSSKTCLVCRAIVASWPSFYLSSELADIMNGYSSKIVVTATRQMPSGVIWKFLDAVLAPTNRGLPYSGSFTLESLGSHYPASKLPVWNNLAATFDESVSLIKLWLDDCLSHHFPEDCHPVPFSPTRLLTVGQDGRLPRLVGTESIPLKEARYAALSHCWGGQVPLRTTRDNVAAFTQEIPWALIPKTFSDAMLMARRLGIPYVWIDALCIVQDDDEEWQKEAACMGNIYEGSHLTICAAQSANSTQGCFPPEVSNHQDDLSIFRTNAGNQCAPDVIVRVSLGDIPSRALLDNKITGRGWTLQEQMLSPRVVSCLQPDMHWYCKSCYRTQSGHIFGSRDILERHTPWETPILYRRLLQESHLWHSIWRKLVTNYSGRSFTVIQDKIPAIAGLTRYFALAMDDVPLLGLWKNTFAADLTWVRITRPPDLLGIQGLPSWTWLSCAGRIIYSFLADSCDVSPESQWIDQVQLLAWEIHWTGTPLTSSPNLARVKVDGPVSVISIATFPTGNTFNPPRLQVFGENLVPTNNTQPPWRCAGQFDAGPVVTGEYQCLLLRSQTSNVHTAEIFLVLESVGPKTDMTYKRIGIVRVRGNPPAFDPSRRMSIFLV